LLKQFATTLDFEYARLLLLNVCNNMVECAKYDTQEEAEYHRTFNEDVLNKYLDKVLGIILEQDVEVQNRLITMLLEYAKHEEFINIDELKNKINSFYHNEENNGL